MVESFMLEPKDILNVFTLRLKNKKFEAEYNISNAKNQRKLNIAMTLFSLIFSITLLIINLMSIKQINYKIIETNITIETISNKTLLEEINLNKSSISQEELFFGNLLVTNNSLLNILTNDTSNAFILPKNLSILKIISDYHYASISIILIIVLFSINFLEFFLSLYLKNPLGHKIIFVFQWFSFGFNFNTLAIAINSYLEIDTEYIYFVMVFQLLIKVLITNQTSIQWLKFLVSSLLVTILEFSFVFSGMNLLGNNFLFYLEVNAIVQLTCIIVYYYNEKKGRREFYLLKKINVEREYLIDLIYNMDQGFINFNKDIFFINKSMKTIMGDFEFEKKKKIEKIKKCGSKDSINILISSPKKQSNSFESPVNFFKSNINIECKNILEQLMSNISELNPDLPSEISNLFKIFEIDIFYDIVKDKKEFSKFTNLGIVNINIRNTLYKSIKKYQIMFRIISNNNRNSKFLEIIFTDVSFVVESEREKAVVNTRSMYLSKIEHEFKNPLSSILELSSTIIDELKDKFKFDLNEEEESTIKNLILKADHIDKICRIMTHFLKDYSLFTNLKFPCEKACEDNNYLFCSICKTENLCLKCKLCKHCENLKESTFDSNIQIISILDTFSALSKYERDTNNPQFKGVFNQEQNVIKIDNELFCSAIYNLIYHSYKSSHSNADIIVKVNQTKNENNTINTEFEISDSSLEIVEEFINQLYYNDKFQLEIRQNFDVEDDNADKFNKYFEIYVAFFLIKKMGSTLNIVTSKTGSKYFFSINNINIIETQLMVVEFPQVLIINGNNNLSQGSSSEENTLIFDQPILYDHSEELELKINSEPNSSVISINIDLHSEMGSNNIRYTKETNAISVLIVDDESLIRKTIKRHFTNISNSTEHKFEIEEATNCFEAINILYNSLKSNLLFDFIIIDEYMPNMKGSTLIKLLKQLHSENNFYNPTIISHTAFDTIEKKKFILQSGADYILSKPVEFSKFKEFILNLISKIV